MLIQTHNSIAERILFYKQDIANTCLKYGKIVDQVRIVAVSKGHSVAVIREAIKNGLLEFGENYWQELCKKQHELGEANITWHFIGHIQSNKVKKIAAAVDWVHSIDTLEVITLLNQYRPEDLSPLNVCIQINLDHEYSKSGTTIPQLYKLVDLVLNKPKLKLRGLMALPKAQQESNAQYQDFMRFTAIYHELNQQLDNILDTLSMGMSNDYQQAIHADSTLLRLGTALFGCRGMQML